MSAASRRARPLLRVSAAMGTAALLIAVASLPASAAGGENQWWYDVYGVAEVHAEGWTGEGIKIAVIDSQINPDLPVFEGADLTVAPGAACAGSEPATNEVTDESRHGSTVTALLIGNGTGAGGIVGIVPDASVTFYGLGTLEGCEPVAEAAAAGYEEKGWAIRRALDDGAQIISISQGGGNGTNEDVAVIAEAIARKVPIVAAVPNDAMTMAHNPSMFNGVVSVNAVDRAAQLLLNDWGTPNEAYETVVAAPGSPFSSIGAPGGTWDDSNLTEGSSLATPLVAGILAAAAQKYPDATGDQLIQSLIHNTGTEDHALQFSKDDGYGYGVASLGHVLSKDPSVYDDVNPLMDKDLDQPTAEEVAAAAAALSSPEPTDAASDPPAETPDGFDAIATTTIVVAAVVLAVVAAAAVLTIVLVRRSRRQNREGQS